MYRQEYGAIYLGLAVTLIPISCGRTGQSVGLFFLLCDFLSIGVKIFNWKEQKLEK
ncbi:MAG: hypothetical protein DIU64_006415 [Caldicoprobacter oshimai]|nr:hypothetical protein [Caldicoprobacter faecalis]